MKPTSISILLAFLLLASAYGQTETASRPNILYFYVDDMGWGAIGPNAQAARKARGLPSVRTPNLDQLAADGVNFSRGYGCMVCSPARSSQQTGFHQGHTFADRNDPDNAKKAMRADDVLMGDALSRAGYVTGYWGKWGYGGSSDQLAPRVDNVQTLPTSHGYQHVVAELHHVRAHTFFQPTLWTAPAAPGSIGGIELKPNAMTKYRGDPAYPNTPALQNHPDYPATAYCDDVYAFAALDFVREQARVYRKTGQPFFGLLAVQIPHGPFNEVAKLPEWDAAYRADPHFSGLKAQSRQWAAMVTRIDAHFGNILAALEDPNGDGNPADSVARDTLVVFQSDNGGPGGDALRDYDANGGLSGTKGKIQEGGIRVPTIMRWPGKITAHSRLKKGSSTARIVDVTDLLPTDCELAGAPAPLGVDGVSIAPTLRGAGHQRVRNFLVHEAGNGNAIIRGRFKLVQGRSGKKKQRKEPATFSLRLFDLDADPGEKHDLAAKHPALVKELETLLIGERVNEAKGFANTYHDWTGKNGGLTSDPDNWSDYVYANAGTTYMSDRGPPRLSWVAHMNNPGPENARAVADSDLAFLALEISGSPARQMLELGPGVNLTGRNEIRLGGKGSLMVNGGTVSSLRWIDVKAGGTLQGTGKIAAVLYNQGRVRASGLDVQSDYHQSPDASLHLAIGRKGGAPLRIRGEARLAGTLAVSLVPGLKLQPGETIIVLSAEHIEGAFGNTGNRVVADDGTRFKIAYAADRVTLSAM